MRSELGATGKEVFTKIQRKAISCTIRSSSTFLNNKTRSCSADEGVSAGIASVDDLVMAELTTSPTSVVSDDRKLTKH